MSLENETKVNIACQGLATDNSTLKEGFSEEVTSRMMNRLQEARQDEKTNSEYVLLSFGL